ncbi:nitrosoguanidine resistance protein [Colletotrichum sojae]|uniref:Nitrosoguanidine resistance protein n=1 Tax=Colletotrichum sojae TaxID=2175907 RepID=A0A8H6IPY0_9PEZI|nr:nitrosoguanidine resistance protein [Colletotrichum sojae]
MSSQAFPTRTPLWQWPAAQRKGALMAMIMPSFLILLLVLANMSYLLGTTFEQTKRSHALKILAVDYDEGAIGAAVSQASKSLQNPSFPTIEFASASEYSEPAAVKNAVCRGDYWAAIYTPAGASSKLASAINGTLSGEYNPADSVVYTYNQARYPTVADSTLLSSVQKIVGAARGAYYQSPNGTAALASVGRNPAGAAAFLNPIQSTADLIRPTVQGSRAFFNTVNIIIPTLAQFFYLLALNGTGASTGFLARARVLDVWVLRFGIAKIYAFLTALTVTGYLWAFRESWGVGGSEFGLTLLVFWLYMDVQWQVLESLIASFVPMHFSPFFFLTWIIVNIASVVTPLELMPGFYRLGYALPAREAYSLMVLAWSGCGAGQTRIALPVLFSWWVGGQVLAVFSIRKRCADAGKLAAAAAVAADADGDEQMPPRSASTELTLRSDEEQVRNEK